MINPSEAPIVLVVSTRSECIKMAPVYLAFKRAGMPIFLCSLVRSHSAVMDVFHLFDIQPDFQFDAPIEDADQCVVMQAVLGALRPFFDELCPALILVHGDSTSSMAAALAAFYKHIPLAHVEAGLRTDDIYAPFPDEVNRRMMSVISTYHFAPTPAAVANILAHGARRDQVFCTGNTAVDAFHIMREKISAQIIPIDPALRAWIQESRDVESELMLLTVGQQAIRHGNVESILALVEQYAKKNPDVRWVYLYEPTQQVAEWIAATQLANLPNIFLSELASYQDIVYALDAVDIVVTDSGSLQEEATSLAKPVIVLKEKTERMEGVLAGYAWVVGINEQRMYQAIEAARAKMMSSHGGAVPIHADGHAAEKIVAFIQSRYDELQKRLCDDKTINPVSHHARGQVQAK